MGDPAAKPQIGPRSPSPSTDAGPRAIRLTPNLELSAASRLVGDVPGGRMQAARRMVTAAALHGVDLSLMWGTVDRAADGRPIRVRQVCLAVVGSGKTVMMMVSGPGGGPPAVEEQERVASIHAACEYFEAEQARGARPVRLAQTLAEPRETWSAAAFLGAGFRKVGDLAYLKRPMAGLPEPDPTPWPAGIEVRSIQDPADRPLLLAALERTYQNTLDCPELCGLRETADVLDSHRSTGVFDPRRWWIVLLNGEPHGCALFSHCPDHNSVELVYLGLSPALRSRGLGTRVLSHGLSSLRGIAAEKVTCAVDLRNTPAQRLYARFGFREFGRRIAMVRPLRAG